VRLRSRSHLQAFGTISPEDVMKSVELFAREVMPAFANA
jgi:hypothetical protein